MVALLLYAYARRARSSRAIERACEEDVAFRVLAAHRVPDHTTIARLRQRHQEALAGLFDEVLALCAMPVWSAPSARRRWHQGPCERVGARPAITSGSRATSWPTPTRSTPRRTSGSETGAATSCPRRWAPERVAAKSLADAKRRLEQRLAQEARPIPASRPARLREAKRRLEEEYRVEVQANADYEAYRARGVDKKGRKSGRPAKPFEPPATPVGKINTTDPDSRNVKTLRGWVQGYNAQAVTTDRQIVIAAELTNSGRASLDGVTRSPLPATSSSCSSASSSADRHHLFVTGGSRRRRHGRAVPADESAGTQGWRRRSTGGVHALTGVVRPLSGRACNAPPSRR